MADPSSNGAATAHFLVGSGGFPEHIDRHFRYLHIDHSAAGQLRFRDVSEKIANLDPAQGLVPVGRREPDRVGAGVVGPEHRDPSVAVDLAEQVAFELIVPQVEQAVEFVPAERFHHRAVSHRGRPWLPRGVEIAVAAGLFEKRRNHIMKGCPTLWT